jgi:hypothetical protein
MVDAVVVWLVSFVFCSGSWPAAYLFPFLLAHDDLAQMAESWPCPEPISTAGFQPFPAALEVQSLHTM